jgi:hypothetical protein
MLQLLQVKGWLHNRNLSARERKKVSGPGGLHDCAFPTPPRTNRYPPPSPVLQRGR